MEVPAGQDGIQRLLASEKEAQSVVAKARKARTDRLKQAKDEADREVQAYKAQREEDFKRRQTDDSSASEESARNLIEEAEATVRSVQQSIQDKKEDVLKLLLKHVTTV
ncbi:V-type proton ATPase subunit G [Auxenochlorella protothecoides]|uniref:V-type proton ATPase subunit G n=1 Tax=Auxenochlorella protothecoides TaxID=3075 RepID=A0A087SNS9_AUXPR|nr:V-type proton ATPase subunit G [Auxenochlorella protothecoides]KFM27383.1 V-type proton ATPase subunit G [Auxenochlorella protothecoides]RMZ54212.1 hypothetical protein APUTEX25_005368 [Auxenochlorella protothecoides]|eukprot:RMZ54212.1 hypothetical protein APUTEX25_005368 [Auxenochlorella protothecoides]